MLLCGCEAWRILAQCHKYRVQILQNKFLKIIFDGPCHTRISEFQDVALIPYIADLLDSHVKKIFNIISNHEKRYFKRWDILTNGVQKHRNIFVEFNQTVLVSLRH